MHEPPRIALLPDNERKNYWSVHDVFARTDRPVCAFLHRNYEIGMHAHEFTEINFVVRGRGEHYFQKHVFSTEAGDVFVVPPQHKHGYTHADNLDVYHLLVSPRFFAEHSPRLRVMPGFLLFFTVEPYFRAETSFRYGLHLDAEQFSRTAGLLDMLQSECAEPLPGQEVALTSLTLYLMSCLCRWYMQQHPAHGEAQRRHPQTQAISHVVELIAERYAEKLTLTEMAGVAHMQRNYFCRTFHDVTGVTPMEYLSQYRVQMARRLLVETKFSVTEIGNEVGYYDTSHFCRTFTRIVGISPSRYRKRTLLEVITALNVK